MKYELVKISYSYSYRKNRYTYPVVKRELLLLLPVDRKDCYMKVLPYIGSKNFWGELPKRRSYHLEVIKRYDRWPSKSFAKLSDIEKYLSFANFKYQGKLNLFKCKIDDKFIDLRLYC